MVSFISRNILTGLITLLPVVLTLYLLYWFAVSAEALLGDAIRLVLPESLYWPGMGVVAALAGAFMVGLLMHAYVVQRLFNLGEQLLYHTPVIKSVYRSIRDFLDYFSPVKKREFDQVVAVTLGNTDMQVIGFVTEEIPENLPEGFRQEGSVLVYLPLSYMIGGYAVLMPRASVKPLKLSVEEAMRFTLSAGITGSTPSPLQPKPTPRV